MHGKRIKNKMSSLIGNLEIDYILTLYLLFLSSLFIKVQCWLIINTEYLKIQCCVSTIQTAYESSELQLPLIDSTVHIVCFPLGNGL